ncbi:MAG: hypothetical protein KKA81_13170 [Bacteroidetes bacterium]|nr:hypothetical protein [Bacteroidota bacterium]
MESNDPKSGENILSINGLGKVYKCFTISGQPLNSQNGYTASAWINGDNHTSLKIGVNNDTYSEKIYVTGSGWNLYTVNLSQAEIENLQAPIQIKVTVEVEDNDDEAFVDDIRFYPSDALIQTYSHDPKSRILSTSGTNSRFSYFEYDDWGRLFLTRDDDKYITARYDYTVSSTESFIKSQIILIDDISSAGDIDNLSIGEKAESRKYFNGLGNIIQVVNRQVSPNGKDMVNAFVYDCYGRDTIHYLPYASNETNGLMKTDPIGDIEDFYVNAPRVAHTLYPYAITSFDDSPMNRIEKQGFAGKLWQPGEGHEIETDYSFNEEDHIINFSVIPSTGACDVDNSNKYYPENELVINQATDENGQTGFVCVDKSGKTIAKINTVDSESIYTYYVYDDFGRIRYIIPPEAFDDMVAADDYDFSWTDQIATKYIFCFKYDEKGRLTERQLPGRDKEYLVYDKVDRVILSQDGNLRDKSTWNFAKYDLYGRKIMSGLYYDESSLTGSQMQAVADNFYSTYPDNFFEDTVSFTTMDEGYTFHSFPDSYNNSKILNVAYYDDYRFDENEDYLYQRDVNLRMPADPNNRLREYKTGGKTKTLDGSNNWLYNLQYFDNKGRIIQSISDNHLSGYDLIRNELMFDGRIRNNRHDHVTSVDSITQYRQYTYDHAGRILKLKYGINNQNKFLMYSNNYNELGQLIEKNLHSPDNGISFWQSVDYIYNVRGWLTHINQSNLDNSNSIINYNEYLETDESVQGIKYDSLKISFEEISAGQLEIRFSDYKSLYIVQLDDTSQTRYLDIDEYTEENMFKEESDTTEFNKLLDISGDSITFDIKGLFFDKYFEQGMILDSIDIIVRERLEELGYTDTIQIDAISSKISAFIYSDIPLVYFNEDGDDLFGMDILYNEGLTALDGTPQYNGNISGIRWQAAQYDGIRGYGVQYDDLYQMTQAKYGDFSQGSWSVNNNYGVYNIQYDLNGNIKYLDRKGYTGEEYGYQVIDDLYYQYSGNQLTSVTDDASYTTSLGNDFNDNGNRTNDDYSYDDNGNLISDKNKGITSITYNHFNLPDTITFDASHYLIIYYDATGKKLSKKVVSGQNTFTWVYINGFVYKNAELQYILTEEGRMVPANDTILAEYFLRDHLGTVRVVCTDTDNDTIAEIIQENHYYPFGMEFSGTRYMNGQPDNPYMYQGKENHSGQQWLNLNLYDFGARMFDGQTGRWNVPDPVNQGTSPYSAMGNNPVGNVDPDGCYFYFKPGLFLEHHKQLNAFRFPGSHMTQDSYNFLNNKNLWSSMEWSGQNWNDFLDYCYGRGKYTLQGPAYGTSLTWTSVDGVGGFLSTSSQSGNIISTGSGKIFDASDLSSSDGAYFKPDGSGEMGQYIQISGTWLTKTLNNRTVGFTYSSAVCVWVPIGDIAPGWGDVGWVSSFNSSYNSVPEWVGTANSIVGAFMIANTTKEQLISYAARTGDIGKTGSKYLRFVKSTGVAGALFGMGVSGYHIYNDYSQGGIDAVNGWDVADFSIGAASLGATIFLASNPVGWGIAIIAGAYFGARLIYDVAKED